MTFDEAVTAVSDQPDLCLTGLALDGRGEWLTVYFLCSKNPESAAPVQVQLTCERVQLFGSQREVFDYEVDSAPTEAMLLEFTDQSTLLERRNVGEHTLLALFPELPPPEGIDKEEFRVLAIRAAEASAFVTVVSRGKS